MISPSPGGGVWGEVGSGWGEVGSEEYWRSKEWRVNRNGELRGVERVGTIKKWGEI